MSDELAKNVIREMGRMPLEMQWRILDFAHALAGSNPEGTEGEKLLRFTDTFSHPDLQDMASAIEEDCETVRSTQRGTPPQWIIYPGK